MSFSGMDRLNTPQIKIIFGLDIKGMVEMEVVVNSLVLPFFFFTHFYTQASM